MMIMMVKKFLIIFEVMQIVEVQARKRVLELDEYDRFFALFIYFFRRYCRPWYIHIRCYRIATVVSRIYKNIHAHVYTRAINLFKCYSEIISEHDRALRIYCEYNI